MGLVRFLLPQYILFLRFLRSLYEGDFYPNSAMASLAGTERSRNNRIGLGNSVDFGVTCASLRGGVWGLLGGLLYLGSDYLTYKNTGMDIREHLNLKYSISW